jgi:hypothetical protein
MLTLLFRAGFPLSSRYCSDVGSVHFRRSAVTQQSDDSGLILNIWQRVIKKNTEKALFTQLIRRLPGSEHYASGGALVNIKWSDCKKGGYFL